MASASTGGLRLVRCPKCFNILPEPPNVTVYECGGCNAVLRAKVRASSGQNNVLATKQVRQDSDDFSVATAASNGGARQNKELAVAVSGGAAMDSSSCTPGAPTTHETEQEGNGPTSSNENGRAMPSEKNGAGAADAESKEDCSLDGQNSSGRIEGPSGLTHPDPGANGTDSQDRDSDEEEENNAVEGSPENPEDRKVSEGDDDIDMAPSSLNALEHEAPSPERKSKPDHEQMGARERASEANIGANIDEADRKGHLARVQSRSCDLRESDFHSARTSLQSKSFRASEPLQSKIMKTVDELRGDLSEFFSKPEDCKPAAAAVYPPRPSKQDSYNYKPRAGAAVTASAPLTAYHPTPAAKYSDHVARRSRSGQVPPPPPRGLPSLRYRRHRACSFCHSSGQMEMARRACSHECCHSCRPPCDHHQRSWKQEDATQIRPPVQEVTKRRLPPRHHCRPVLRGAPFVVCSGCHSLVQLPTDFAVPSKATRRLQCGFCSEVLSYSYRDPAKKKLQSPSDESLYSTDDHEIRQVDDDDHRAGGFNVADPFSYSEEYGVSYSTEDEQQPLHVSRNSSFNTIDERNAKLHLLMGYPSARELRRRRSPDLFEERMPPAARTNDRKGKGIYEEDGNSGGQDRPVMKASKARGGGLPLHGILKKGIHGLESLKLRS